MKDNLIFASVILGIITFFACLGLGLVVLKHNILKHRIEKTGIEVIETTKLGRPTKVVTMTGDTCMVIPGTSFVKISK